MSEQERSDFLLEKLREMRRGFAKKLANQPDTETEPPANQPAQPAETAGSAEPMEGWIPLGAGQYVRGRVAEWLTGTGGTAPGSVHPEAENPWARLT